MKKRTWYVAGAVGVLILVVFAAAALLNERRTAAESSGGSVGMAIGAPSFVEPLMGQKMMNGSFNVSDESAVYPYPAPTAGQTAAEVDQRIIKNGTLRLVVDDVGKAADKLVELASKHKGFVQSSSVSEVGDGTRSGEVTIRVPADQFEAAVKEAKSLANLVRYESSTGQDVTEQYSDFKAQLRNAQAQETTYLAILRQARTVEDILKVQERLGQIRGVIESLQGQLKYLENVTSYSTISVSLEEEAAVRAPTKEFRPGSIASQAVQALVNLAQQLAAGVIWLVIVGGGILIPLAALLWIILAIVKRQKQR